MTKDPAAVLRACLQELHLPAVRAQYEAVARQAQAETWTYPAYLCEVLERECQQRRQHRNERGSVLLTSNLPFSKWDQVFKDPMTTAAAVDRLVHHSVIVELNVPSYRAEAAKKSRSSPPPAEPPPTSA